MEFLAKKRKIGYKNKTGIMGIVNVTPDSFSDGGNFIGKDNAIKRVKEHLKNGVDIIDLGAQSTRPGYQEISPQDEWERLEGIIEEIKTFSDVPISVDTYFPYVAEKCALEGVDIINDVSGKITREMAEIVKKYDLGWIVTFAESGKSDKVREFSEQALKEITSYGVDEKNICFDPGIGFGKNFEQDKDILENVNVCRYKDFPILYGFSRKRVIGRLFDIERPLDRTPGNIEIDIKVTKQGVDFIRLHNTEEEIPVIRSTEWTK